MSTHRQALYIGGPKDGEIGDDTPCLGYCRHEVTAGFNWVFYVHYSMDLAQAMMKLITGYKQAAPDDASSETHDDDGPKYEREAEQRQDEKRGLYPDKEDIAN